VTTDGTALTYEWNFGEGAVSGDTTASYTWNVTGTYDVVFTATDTCGYYKVTKITITVNEPNLQASFDKSADTVVVSTTVHFTDTSTTSALLIDAPAITQWWWDFGDGSAPVTTRHPEHTYLVTGTHTVTLVVTDALGFSDQATDQVTVNEPNLVADFAYVPMPAHIETDDTVTFTDQSTTDGPEITQWQWNFGDGSALSTDQNPMHVYTQVGTYTVSLLVTDALGYSDDEVKADIVVVAPSCTELTSADFAYAPPMPMIQSPVVFTATYTPVDASEPITYEWDFGDGQTATVSTASVQHTYANAGEKTVKVTIKNPCTLAGMSKEATVTVAPLRVYLPLVMRGQ
jgi:PKD repeat protein